MADDSDDGGRGGCDVITCQPSSSKEQNNPHPKGDYNNDSYCAKWRNLCLYWDEIPSPYADIPPPDEAGYVIKPIKNFGNTCFMSVIIQCLNQTTEIHETLFSVSCCHREYQLDNTFISRVSVDTHGLLSKELANLFDEIQSTNTHCIVPRQLLDVAIQKDDKYSNRTQEDCHEFMRFLFQHIRSEEVECMKQDIHSQCASENISLSAEEMKEVLKSADKCVTPIEKIFGGVLINTIICQQCLTPLQLKESFFDLALSIPEFQGRRRLSLPRVMSPTRNINKPGSAKDKVTRTPSLDSGNIKPLPSCESGHSSTVDHSITSVGAGIDAATSPTLSVYSGDEVFSHNENSKIAHDFALLQNYLRQKVKYYYQPDALGNMHAKTDLEESLKDYISLDVLDKDNLFNCDVCEAKAKGPYKGSLVSKQTMIIGLQEVLILHINRFKVGGQRMSKDNRVLSFPHVLNMAPYCADECSKELRDKGGRIMYGLYAVIVHIGPTLRSGHYMTYVKRRPARQQGDGRQTPIWEYDIGAASSGVWYSISDETIYKCHRGFDDVRGQKAYLLFYELLPKLSC